MLPTLLTSVVLPGRALQGAGKGLQITWLRLVWALFRALVPLWLAAVCLGTTWWYVVIHSQEVDAPVAASVSTTQKADNGSGLQEPPAAGGLQEPPAAGGLQEPPAAGGLQEPSAAGGLQEPSAAGGLQEPPAAGGLQEPPGTVGGVQEPPGAASDGGLQAMEGVQTTPAKAPGVPDGFKQGFGVAVLLTLALLVWYYAKFDAEQFEILTMLISSVMPLATLTLVVLGVILFGITTATESAAVGAAGAFLMAFSARSLTFQKTKEAVFLTAKTTSMVCWLFVGSALFSAVFAILGGQRLVEEWVLALNLTPLQFMLLSQAIIFVLGWPLEWTEIIVIFVPIFLPLLQHFEINPILWGVLVFVNLQAAFLSPPVAMSAFYLKGVSPPHVTINQIFAGMMPYMLIVILCMVLMYIWPGLTLWLPTFLYGG
jgi:TRAP-type mannitol/chloroaromatic compound transport system permease large subunit